MGFCHLLRVPCNVRCLPDQRALQPHLRVGFCRLLRTACDVHCFYSLINFNNMVHIYQVFQYNWYRGCCGLSCSDNVSYIKCCQVELLGWRQYKEGGMYSAIKTVDTCMCNSVAELLTRGAGVLVPFLVQPCFKCIYMLIHPFLLQIFTKVGVKSSAGW